MAVHAGPQAPPEAAAAGPGRAAPEGMLVVTMLSNLPPERLGELRFVSEAGEMLVTQLRGVRPVGEAGTYAYTLYVSDRFHRVRVLWRVSEEGRRALVPLEATVGLGL